MGACPAHSSSGEYATLPFSALILAFALVWRHCPVNSHPRLAHSAEAPPSTGIRDVYFSALWLLLGGRPRPAPLSTCDVFQIGPWEYGCHGNGGGRLWVCPPKPCTAWPSWVQERGLIPTSTFYPCSLGNRFPVRLKVMSLAACPSSASSPSLAPGDEHSRIPSSLAQRGEATWPESHSWWLCWAGMPVQAQL